MSVNGFRAAGFPWRLYCGRQVLEQSLKEAVARAGAKRAFVICSPSITRRTDTVARIAAALGDFHAGVFDAVENDATYTSVRAATSATCSLLNSDSTPSTPKSPSTSATATGQIRLYCISSLVRGRRRDSGSAAAKVWITTDSTWAAGIAAPSWTAMAAVMPGCVQRQHGYGLT